MATIDWVDRTMFPFESKYIDIGRKRFHYVDEGHGPTVVFVHGCPAWSFMYRHLIRGLKDSFRCIALDSLGYGLSDKPTNASYRPERQAEYLADFIDRLRIANTTLIAHGTGGPAAIDYAERHSANVSHLVLMNTFMWSMSGNDAVAKIDKQVNGPLGRLLYLNFNLSIRRMKRSINDWSHTSKEAFSHYVDALDEPAERVAPFGFAKSLLGSSDFYDSLWARREELAKIPTMLVWGMKDPVFGASALERMRIALPDAEVKRLPETGHFVPEEKGSGLATYIEMFLNDTAYVSPASLI